MANKTSQGDKTWILYAAGAGLCVLGLGIAIYFLSQEDDPII